MTASTSNVVAAGEIGKFVGGNGFPVRFQGHPSGEIPFFKVSDMNSVGNELFLRKANNYIDESSRRAIGATVIPAGSIVFAKVGAAVFLERKRILSQDSCIDNNMAAFMVDPESFDIRFIHYLMSAFKLASLAATGALPSLNGRQLRAIPLRVPLAIDEQRAISQTLSDVDQSLRELEKLISKKHAIKQGMMHELLTGATRLPEFAGEWIYKPLGELCEMRSGSPKEEHNGGTHWIADMGSVTRGAKLVVNRKTDDPSGHLSPGELVMPKDDIGGGQIIGRTGLIPGTGSYVLADHVYALTPKGVDPAFLNLAINSKPVNTALRSKATGTAQLGLSRKSVLEQVVLLPKSIDEQEKIASTFLDVNLELEALERRLGKTRAMKQGMMQELLTGRSRLTSLGV